MASAGDQNLMVNSNNNNRVHLVESTYCDENEIQHVKRVAELLKHEQQSDNRQNKKLKKKHNKKKEGKTLRKIQVNPTMEKIWDVLNKVDAGLTVADWLIIDKEAKQDLQAGLRYLNKRKKKSESMDVGNIDVAKELIDDDNSSYYSTDDDCQSIDSTATVNSEINSVQGYEYSLENMKTSHPFKASILIGNEIVLAIFDTDASVSIINEDLVEKLGLVPNGDQLTLIGFDNKSKFNCDVIMNILIKVGGKLRPEHMCVQKHGKKNSCLIGMTWFKNYGIKQDFANNTILIPTGESKQHVEVKGGYIENGDDVALYDVSMFNVEINEVDDSNLIIQDVKDTDLLELIQDNQEFFVKQSGNGLVEKCHTWD